MGAVLLARDVTLHREVALKLLARKTDDDDDEARKGAERFIAEARAAAKLVHPHIVQIFEVGVSGDNYFIAMEVVRQGTVEDLVKQQGPMDYRKACELAAQAAEALAYAHESDMIHRDIKPANLLLTDKGHVKIADFGLVRAMSGEDTEKKVVGTPYYMSPEMAKAKSSPQSDIFALGAVLWFMLTGKPPFALNKPTDVVRIHHDIPLPDLRDFQPNAPSALIDLLHRALAYRPEDRFESAEDMAAELRTLAIGAPNLEVTEELASLTAAAAANATPAKKEVAASDRAEPADQSKSMLMILAGGGVLGLLIIGVVAYVIFSTLTSNSPSAQTAENPSKAPPSRIMLPEETTPPAIPENPEDTQAKSENTEPEKAEPKNEEAAKDPFEGLPRAGAEIDEYEVELLNQIAAVNSSELRAGRDGRVYSVLGTARNVSNGNGQMATFGEGNKDSTGLGDFYFTVSGKAHVDFQQKFNLNNSDKRDVNMILHAKNKKFKVTGVIRKGRFGPTISVNDVSQVVLLDPPKPIATNNDNNNQTDDKSNQNNTNVQPKEEKPAADTKPVLIFAGSGYDDIYRAAKNKEKKTFEVTGYVIAARKGGNWYELQLAPSEDATDHVRITFGSSTWDALTDKWNISDINEMVGQAITASGVPQLNNDQPWLRELDVADLKKINLNDLPLDERPAPLVDAADIEAMRKALSEKPNQPHRLTGKIVKTISLSDGALALSFDSKAHTLIRVSAEDRKAFEEVHGKGGSDLMNKNVEALGILNPLNPNSSVPVLDVTNPEYVEVSP